MYVCELMPLSLPHVLILYIFYTYMMTTGADPGAAGGAPGERAPKIEKNMIFWRKIVIFHTKYFLSAPPPPNLKSWIRP